MPRKNKIHPSLLPEHADADAMGGHPDHGDPYPEDEDLDEELEQEFDETDELERPEDRVARLERDVVELREQNKLLQRAIPPTAPARDPEPTEDEPDWDALLFQDPKGTLELYGNRVAEKVKRELRGEYNTNESTKRFWADFDSKNKDLKGDRKLVEFVMQEHFNELANIPVDKAIEKLADLTRQQIMQYSNRGGGKRKSRAVAEGADTPRTRAEPTPEPVATASLSALLTKRRQARRAKPNGRSLTN